MHTCAHTYTYTHERTRAHRFAHTHTHTRMHPSTCAHLLRAHLRGEVIQLGAHGDQHGFHVGHYTSRLGGHVRVVLKCLHLLKHKHMRARGSWYPTQAEASAQQQADKQVPLSSAAVPHSVTASTHTSTWCNSKWCACMFIRYSAQHLCANTCAWTRLLRRRAIEQRDTTWLRWHQNPTHVHPVKLGNARNARKCTHRLRAALHTHTHARMHTHMHAHTHAHQHTLTHAHTHAHTHTRQHSSAPATLSSNITQRRRRRGRGKGATDLEPRGLQLHIRAGHQVLALDDVLDEVLQLAQLLLHTARMCAHMSTHARVTQARPVQRAWWGAAAGPASSAKS